MSFRDRSADAVCCPDAAGRAPRTAASALCLGFLAAFAGGAPLEAQVSDRTSKAVSGPLTGKPVAAFALEHEIDSTPHVGVPVELRLTLRPQFSVADIVLHLSTDAGLQLGSPGAVLSADIATREEPAEWLVTVVPMQEGLFHVKVYAEGLMQGSRQGRGVMIPIRVGGERAKAAAEKASEVVSGAAAEAVEGRHDEPAEKDPGDEALMRLPAEEHR